MNRVLKFRAWDKKNKYMIPSEYGYWISFDGVCYNEANKKHNTPNLEITKSKGYELMQFTGLKDGNGKEIYESDIVKFYSPVKFSNNKNEFIAPVVFENGAFTIDILKSNLAKTNGDCYHWGLTHDWTLGTRSIHTMSEGSMEVIGNIFENENLIK